MTTSAEQLAIDLGRLLTPYDERDTPVPGFPTGDAVIAWAKTKDVDDLIEALLDVLRFDGFAQQAMAIAILREVGIEVDAQRSEDSLRWIVDEPGRARMTIEPAQQPTRPSSDNVETVQEAIHRASENLVYLRDYIKPKPAGSTRPEELKEFG